MGERLIYHSSFGFSIIIAVFMYWLLQKISSAQAKNVVTILLICAITISSSALVIPRNAQWKNDTSLFIADAETVPNSALVNGNAGKAFIDLSEKPENKARETELVRKAIYHLSKSVAIHTEYVNGYLNLGVAYYKLRNFDSAKVEWDFAKAIYPNNPFVKRNFGLLAQIYFNEGMTIGGKEPAKAIVSLQKAVEMAPDNDSYWYNLGGAYYTIRDFEKAKAAWNKALELNPANEQAKNGLGAIPK